MRSKKIGPEGRVVSFIDIGTNSVRLLVVRINPNHSCTVLSRQKMAVRLGDGEFKDDVITDEAIARAVMVCRKFTDLARTFNSEEFVAVATSAMREAANQQTILNILRREAGIDVRVISGREEARLIYLGVSSGIRLDGRQAVFIDIGGGSTEIALGDDKKYQYLESFRLGAIRLSNLCLPRHDTKPVTPEQYRRIQRHVKNSIIRPIKKIRRGAPTIAIGSSGTIMNLAEMAQKNYPANNGQGDAVLTYRDLKKLIGVLCSLPLDQRRKVPGINPERADIIIPGAAILDVIMKELSLDEIMITSRGLQDGLLADYLSRMDGFVLLGELSPRQTSVLQLGHSCGINEVHARTVTGLALELFDSAKEIGLHALGDPERELLEYAAFLHDTGSFVSYTNHHAHSWYIIRNSELLGFDQKEIAIIANIARFHRKKPPRRKDPDLNELDLSAWDIVRLLAGFVRLGEILDRSHAALVRHVRFSQVDSETVHLEVIARGDCQLEIWGIESESRAFEKSFGRKLVFDVREIGG